MGKDPAFLFYPADAAQDVSHMNRLERGCYFDLIQAQKKFGRLSEDLIKKVLGHDYELCWESIKICLTYVDHMYFIDWLEESIDKRKKYCESRKSNKNSVKSDDMLNICETHDSTYVKHMVNENENVIEKENLSKKKNQQFIPPSFEEFESYCKEKGFSGIARRAFDGYVAGEWHDAQDKKIIRWKQKLINGWFSDKNKDTKKEQVKLSFNFVRPKPF